MVPHAPPLQPCPLKLQVTALFALPVTVAVNCWLDPTVTVELLGDTEIATPAPAETIRVAGLLVAFPALFVMTTVNSAWLSEATVGGVVYAEEVAPPIAVAFFCHW